MKKTMREVYKEATEGRWEPEYIVVSGEFLNYSLKTTEYDESETYLVGPGGIIRCDNPRRLGVITGIEEP